MLLKKIKWKLLSDGYNEHNRYKKVKRLGVEIGNNCEIYENVSFGSEPYLIKIGDNVRITKGVQFITHDGGVWVLRNKYPEKFTNIDIFGMIIIENNVHIGINSIIMPNVTIGENSIIGCNAIVTKSVPSNSIAVGIPAKVIGTIEDYIEKHKFEFCSTKNLSYLEKKDFLKKKYSENS